MSEQLKFEPMDQFTATVISEPSGMSVGLTVILMIVASLAPVIIAMWVARRFVSKWAYVMGLIAAGLVSVVVSLGFGYWEHNNPRFLIIVLEALLSWLPVIE